MAVSSYHPTKCYKCSATPHCDHEGCNKCKLRLKGECVVGVWTMHTYKEGEMIVWYALCPKCTKEFKYDDKLL